MKPAPEPRAAEITPEALYRDRREFLKRAGLFTATAVGWGGALTWLSGRGQAQPPPPPAIPEGVDAWRVIGADRFGAGQVQTPWDDVTTYNNYYELGLGKSSAAELAHHLRPRPWTVKITGEVRREQELDVDTLIRWFGLEERVYRLRCVEAWSMVIPWVGFPLEALVKRVEPTSAARFVAFTTLFDPEQLPGQDNPILPWPYVEGLRLDEAVHPLTLLAVGLYGRPLPGQNGAPLRLVVPWKYGFKGIKSIVEIRFTRERPTTTWSRAAPAEYGFHANVNPAVDHPRWSQATERRIGELERRPTLLFNGYAEQVAGLYAGLDLAREF